MMTLALVFKLNFVKQLTTIFLQLWLDCGSGWAYSLKCTKKETKLLPICAVTLKAVGILIGIVCLSVCSVP